MYGAAAMRGERLRRAWSIVTSVVDKPESRVASPAGFEPATRCLEGSRSGPLSYGDRPRVYRRRHRARGEKLDWPPMADEPQAAPRVQLQTPQIDIDRQLLRDEDLLNEEHLRRMDQVLLRRNLDHARMFSRKLSLELQNFVHLYTPEANELRRRIETYMVMERMIEKEMARRHTY